MRTQTKETRSVVADVLDEQMEKFLKRLESQDYAPSGVLHYRRRVSEFCAQVNASRMRLDELNENRARDLLVPVELASQKIYSRFMVRNFIRFLIEQGVVNLPTDNSARACLKRDYEPYLRRQRGLSERTIFHAWRIADHFLQFRFGDEIGELSGITAHDIVSFMQEGTGKRQPLRDKTLSSHLRSFFRYLFKAGKTTSATTRFSAWHCKPGFACRRSSVSAAAISSWEPEPTFAARAKTVNNVVRLCIRNPPKCSRCG